MEYASVAKMAEKWGISERSVRNYCALGRIADAKAKGIRFGRPPKPLPPDFDKVYRRWQTGELTGKQAAKELGIPASTFRSKAKRYTDAGTHHKRH